MKTLMRPGQMCSIACFACTYGMHKAQRQEVCTEPRHCNRGLVPTIFGDTNKAFLHAGICQMQHYTCRARCPLPPYLPASGAKPTSQYTMALHTTASSSDSGTRSSVVGRE